MREPAAYDGSGEPGRAAPAARPWRRLDAERRLALVEQWLTGSPTAAA